ncbi:MAG: cytochrome c [Chloroflexi bacterium]|nr:cytochrome c [Chloroflexota bacterium]
MSQSVSTPPPVAHANATLRARSWSAWLFSLFILGLSCVVVLVYAGLPGVATAAASAAAPAPAGNPAAGRALFTGATPLQNGGPTCIACHNVAGLGALGGGSVGPDLTAVYTRYGQAGLASSLSNIAFPAMQPLFRNHPLTPAEQADLIAYFQQTARQHPASPQPAPTGLTYNRRSLPTVQIAFLAVAGTAVLLLLANVVWRDRLTGVRRPLVERR